MVGNTHLRARLKLHLPPTLEATAEARRMTAAACAAWSLEQISPKAALIATELVDNVRVHAGAALVLTLTYRPTYLCISSVDGSPLQRPPATVITTEMPWSRRGRGLRLIGAFADRWGVVRLPGGKRVWAIVFIASGS